MSLKQQNYRPECVRCFYLGREGNGSSIDCVIDHGSSKLVMSLGLEVIMSGGGDIHL